jgi:hypothetical protein
MSIATVVNSYNVVTRSEGRELRDEMRRQVDSNLSNTLNSNEKRIAAALERIAASPEEIDDLLVLNLAAKEGGC